MNRYRCPICGNDQYTPAETAKDCIYCAYKGELNKTETLEDEG